MKRVILPLAIYLIFLTYSLIMLFWGETGVYAFYRLDSGIQQLSENMRTLDIKKTELSQTIKSLRSNPDAMEIEARSMDLYRPGQQVLYFRNIEYVQALPDAGQVLQLNPIQNVDKSLFRTLSFAIGLMFLFFGFIILKVKNVSYSRQ